MSTKPYTAAEKASALKVYKECTLADLRRRQDLCDQQLGMARDDDLTTIENLQTTRSLLTEAVDYVAFEKKT